MKNTLTLLALVASLVSPPLASASETGGSFVGLVQKGNIHAGGSASLTHVMDSTRSWMSLRVNPSAEYFVADRLSVGGTGLYSHAFQTGASTTWAVGPSATYYYALPGDRTALYGDLGLLLTGLSTNTRSTTFWTLNLGTGLDYFLTPSVAIGPSLTWTHEFESQYYWSWNSLTLAGQFRIFF